MATPSFGNYVAAYPNDSGVSDEGGYGDQQNGWNDGGGSVFDFLLGGPNHGDPPGESSWVSLPHSPYVNGEQDAGRHNNVAFQCGTANDSIQYDHQNAPERQPRASDRIPRRNNPFLRPIMFVRCDVLFKDKDEILLPDIVAVVNVTDHELKTPTANRVDRVFDSASTMGRSSCSHSSVNKKNAEHGVAEQEKANPLIVESTSTISKIAGDGLIIDKGDPDVLAIVEPVPLNPRAEFDSKSGKNPTAVLDFGRQTAPPTSSLAEDTVVENDPVQATAEGNIVFEVPVSTEAPQERDHRTNASDEPPEANSPGVRGIENVDINSDIDDTDSGVNGQPDLSKLFEVEQQIREFVEDRGRSTFQLPPIDDDCRKRVKLLVAAFNLKSKDHGKGPSRAPRLTRTTRTKLAEVKEPVAAPVTRSSKVPKTSEKSAVGVKGGGAGGNLQEGEGVERDSSKSGGKRGGKKGGGGSGTGTKERVHREEKIVGQHAAKIAEENVGYRLLQGMGWSEGDRIGITANGLEVPLKVVFKSNKLGLGVSRSR